jgi:hypothetical protein
LVVVWAAATRNLSSVAFLFSSLFFFLIVCILNVLCDINIFEKKETLHPILWYIHLRKKHIFFQIIKKVYLCPGNFLKA